MRCGPILKKHLIEEKLRVHLIEKNKVDMKIEKIKQTRHYVINSSKNMLIKKIIN